jgi:hypothetical protein
MRNAHNILVVNSEEDRPIGKPRYGWEYNIIMAK